MVENNNHLETNIEYIIMITASTLLQPSKFQIALYHPNLPLDCGDGMSLAMFSFRSAALNGINTGHQVVQSKTSLGIGEVSHAT